MTASAPFHPLVHDWFVARFGTPTEPQTRGWPAIASGRDALIAAPTGSGKTLAAFLWCLDGLVRDGLAGELTDAVRVLYVSPLKALGNDIEKNLATPLAELRALAEARGTPFPAIRTAVRSGDTPAAERARALRKPPHVLLTTPESLYLLLGSEGGRRMLGTVKTVIVDEIHAVAGDKRGQHLALSLARLDRLVGHHPQRIGLSATQRPIEEIARLLVGTERAQGPRPDCAIVDEGHVRKLDVAVEVPGDELSSVGSNEMWGQIFDRVADLAREHRTTLVFVDTRRLAERVSRALGERLGVDAVAAHHGSMSRQKRLSAEERLKAGAIRVCVATASLELGIDVGDVDLVCLIGSPRAFAVGLQRIGRAGHGRGRVPKGRIFPTTRDELAECAAFLRGVRKGRLEATLVPRNARDVLAQQIVAEAACGEIGEDELFDLVRSAWPYATLPRETFDAIIEMLSEGVATRRGRASAHLHRDGVNHVVKGRRGARIAALTSGGAIPDTTQYTVIADPTETPVGTVDEDFAIESMAGDVFSLGNTSWRIRRVEAGKLRVEDAGGMPPTMPFWNGEAPGRSGELSAEVGALRADIEPLLGDRARAERWAIDECGLDLAGAKQMVAYLAASLDALGALPTQDVLVAERFFDESGGMQLVLHAPFGQKVNRAFGHALRKRFCRSFDFELQAAADDDGILLSLGPQHSFPLESIFDLVGEHEAEEILVQAALQAPMFGVRWRWNSTRSLAVLRFSGGRKTPPPLVRMRAEDLLSAVFPAQVACQDNGPGGPIEVPNHPLVHETVEDCLHEAMDTDGLVALLGRIARREVRLVARDVAEPSPLCHELVSGRPYTFLDDAPLEERRARAVQLRRSLPEKEVAAFGALDAEAIATVVGQVWPDPRDADELHDTLLGVIALPLAEASGWAAGLAVLDERGRARRVPFGSGEAWVATERVDRLASDDGVYEVIRGWLEIVGPITVESLMARLGLPKLDVDIALARLEMEGFALQGRFSPSVAVGFQPTEWCERRLLARIHRLTLGRLRREIAPVPPSDLLRFLSRWQRIHPGTAAHGPAGLVEVIAQLQGMHLPAAAWEQDVLPARLAGYDPAWLDALCHAGTVGWGRLIAGTIDPDVKRRAPSRNAPITLFVRDDLPWLLPPEGEVAELGEGAVSVLDAIDRRGASFFGELVQAVKKPPAEVEEALWELVAAGRVASDGYAGLRALIGSERTLAARAGGRWWPLRSRADEAVGAEEALERLATQLSKRWGVLFRDMLTREAWAPPWRDLLPVLRRREARGEVRGGRFVNGFTGEQFASSEAIELLRTVRRSEPVGAEKVSISAADPLNVVGLLTPGPRIPALAGGRVVWVDGVPVREEVA